MWHIDQCTETGAWLVLKPCGRSTPLVACEAETKEDAESIAYDLNSIDKQMELTNKIFNVKIKYQIGEVL